MNNDKKDGKYEKSIYSILKQSLKSLIRIVGEGLIYSALSVSKGTSLGYKLEEILINKAITFKQPDVIANIFNAPDLLKSILMRVGYVVPEAKLEEKKGEEKRRFGYLTDVIYALSYPDPYKGIIIEGDPGTGKTFIVEKLAEALRLYPELRLLYLSSLGAAQMIKSLRVFKTVGVNVIDSLRVYVASIVSNTLDALKGDKETFEEFFNEAYKELSGIDLPEITTDNIVDVFLKAVLTKDEYHIIKEVAGKIKEIHAVEIENLIEALNLGKESTYINLEEILVEVYPYTKTLFPKDSRVTGVHFEKYVCGWEDEFGKIFGYWDIAKIAIVANTISGKKDIKAAIKEFNRAVYGEYGDDINIKERMDNLIKFFRWGPLGRARIFPGISIVLIDEADKMSRDAEVQLYEVLDRAYVSIDYFGSLPRFSTLITVFTSNRVRSFTEPFIRRNNYASIERKEVQEDTDTIEKILKKYYDPHVVARALGIREEEIFVDEFEKFIRDVIIGDCLAGGKCIKPTIDELIDLIRGILLYIASEPSLADRDINLLLKDAYERLVPIKVNKNKRKEERRGFMFILSYKPYALYIYYDNVLENLRRISNYIYLADAPDKAIFHGYKYNDKALSINSNLDFLIELDEIKVSFSGSGNDNKFLIAPRSKLREDLYREDKYTLYFIYKRIGDYILGIHDGSVILADREPNEVEYVLGEKIEKKDYILWKFEEQLSINIYLTALNFPIIARPCEGVIGRKEGDMIIVLCVYIRKSSFYDKPRSTVVSSEEVPKYGEIPKGEVENIRVLGIYPDKIEEFKEKFLSIYPITYRLVYGDITRRI